METRAFPKAQVPTLESLEMASRVGVGQGGQAFGKGSRSLGHQLQLLPQVEFLPQGSHIPAHLFD